MGPEDIWGVHPGGMRSPESPLTWGWELGRTPGAARYSVAVGEAGVGGAVAGSLLVLSPHLVSPMPPGHS